MEKKNNGIKRIAVLGPESTAKSTLSEQLAIHYKTVWVPEYSRAYLSSINRKYTLQDVETIAGQQLKQEEEQLKQASNYIFADTELIISKVWCLDVFNTCPEWISASIVKTKYDFYLLTAPDLPWEHDALRENPHRREFLFDWYEQELKNLAANYAIISGVGEQRLLNCINAIDSYFEIRQ